MRGKCRCHEVVHGFRCRVVREVEFAHFVLPPECCAFFELEAVDADVVGCERERFVDVGLEHRECLAWQAVDEVEAEVLEASGTGVTDGGACLSCSVDAADAFQERIVEGLDAEGNSVDAVTLQQRKLGFIDRAGVAFHRKFYGICLDCAPYYPLSRLRRQLSQRESLPDSKRPQQFVQKWFQQIIRQNARRAAADVDGGGISPL